MSPVFATKTKRLAFYDLGFLAEARLITSLESFHSATQTVNYLLSETFIFQPFTSRFVRAQEKRSTREDKKTSMDVLHQC